MELMPVTIYTILQSTKLRAMYREGRVAKFEEGKRWVGAAKLLADATASGRFLPIVFADSVNIYELIFRGIIRKISFLSDQKNKRTVIAVSDLKPIRAPGPIKTDLIVVSTGRPIPESHQRSYVLCRTPSFITRATAPNPRSPADARKRGAHG